MAEKVYPNIDVQFETGQTQEFAIDPDDSALTIVSTAKSVTAAGTAEAIVSSETFAWRVDIVAEASNSGNIYVGDSNVDKDSLKAAPLASGEAYTIECPAGCRMDLNAIYIDADTSGEGIVFNSFTIA